MPLSKYFQELSLHDLGMRLNGSYISYKDEPAFVDHVLENALCLIPNNGRGNSELVKLDDEALDVDSLPNRLGDFSAGQTFGQIVRAPARSQMQGLNNNNTHTMYYDFVTERGNNNEIHINAVFANKLKNSMPFNKYSKATRDMWTGKYKSIEDFIKDPPLENVPPFYIHAQAVHRKFFVVGIADAPEHIHLGCDQAGLIGQIIINGAGNPVVVYNQDKQWTQESVERNLKIARA